MNPSFEQDVSHWDEFQSQRSREQASDAPDGHYVVRVEATDRSGQWGIDDLPDTVQDSVAGRAYTATAWVKGTDATDGKQVCLTIRERPQSSGKSIDQAGAGGLLSADNYQELRVPYVAHGDGHRVDVHVTANFAGAVPGDAFLADAISLTPSDRSRIGTGC